MVERAVLVVLAAGAGRRLGGAAKALLPIGAAGETYLARISATARAVGAARGVVVVAPPYGERVAAEARRLGLDVVENAQPERGMASSVELGFAWAARQQRAEAALLWPCDHPAVRKETVQRLLDAAELGAGEGDAASLDAILPTVDDRGGHPALVRRRLFPELARCAAAPEGARTVLRAARTLRLAVADPGCVVDVDEPAAAARLTAEGA